MPFKSIYKKRQKKLLKFKELEDVFPQVEIGTLHEGICETAMRLQGKRYTIDQALKEMPIPSLECKNNILYRIKKSKKNEPTCTCYYIPLTNDEITVKPSSPLRP